MTPLFATADMIDFVDNGRTTIDKSDENNWLEWLDLTETLARSYNDVSTDLLDGHVDLDGTDVVLETGWRYATADEVAAMFNSFFSDPDPIVNNMSGIVALPEATAFLDLFGDTFAASFNLQGQFWSYGITGTEADGNSSARQATYVSPFEGGAFNTSWLFSDNVQQADGGSWLVRNVQEVPEPSTFVLLLAGVVFAARRAIQG